MDASQEIEPELFELNRDLTNIQTQIREIYQNSPSEQEYVLLYVEAISLFIQYLNTYIKIIKREITHEGQGRKRRGRDRPNNKRNHTKKHGGKWIDWIINPKRALENYRKNAQVERELKIEEMKNKIQEDGCISDTQMNDCRKRWYSSIYRNKCKNYKSAVASFGDSMRPCSVFLNIKSELLAILEYVSVLIQELIKMNISRGKTDKDLEQIGSYVGEVSQNLKAIVPTSYKQVNQNMNDTIYGLRYYNNHLINPDVISEEIIRKYTEWVPPPPRPPPQSAKVETTIASSVDKSLPTDEVMNELEAQIKETKAREAQLQIEHDALQAVHQDLTKNWMTVEAEFKKLTNEKKEREKQIELLKGFLTANKGPREIRENNLDLKDVFDNLGQQLRDCRSKLAKIIQTNYKNKTGKGKSKKIHRKTKKANKNQSIR